MNFKKVILSFSLAASLAVASFATAVPTISTSNTTSKTVEQIHKTIQKFSRDVGQKYQDQVQLKFMVNENNEVIVLSTSDAKIDGFLKSALNYKPIKGNDLTPNKIYILPITFKK